MWLVQAFLSQFLIVQSVGSLRAPVLALIVAVYGFFPQHVSDLLGVFAPPTKEKRTIAVVGNDFRSVLVNRL